jgi:hypothetical protein
MYNKYNVSPKDQRTLDGIVFDSKFEMQAYDLLCKFLGKNYFERSPKYELQPGFRDSNGKAIRAINYVGDFLVKYKGVEYLVDTKGMETPVFKMKEKMLLYVHKKSILKLKSKKKVLAFISEIKQ